MPRGCAAPRVTLPPARTLAAHAPRRCPRASIAASSSAERENPVTAKFASMRSGVTPTQVVLRWHLDHGFVVIPKSVTPERIEANFAVTGFSLSADELEAIDALGHRRGA